MELADPTPDAGSLAADRSAANGMRHAQLGLSSPITLRPSPSGETSEPSGSVMHPLDASTSGVPHSSVPPASPGFGMPVNVESDPATMPERVNFDRLAAQIVSQAVVVREAESQRFQMLLDPPELGELRVEMTRSEDGELAVRLSAARWETTALLTRHTEEIQQTLSERGIALSDLDIASQERDDARREFEAEEDESKAATGPADPSATHPDAGSATESELGRISFTA